MDFITYYFIIEVSLQEIRKFQHAPRWFTHNWSPRCGRFQSAMDWLMREACGDTLTTCLPARSSARRLLLMALTGLAQPGLQLSVTEPDFIRAITAKVSWTLGVNQWPPPGAGEGVQGRAYCLEYAWKPIGFACLSGHMDPDGIMSDLTLIHIILPSNQYWDLTSHSEGSPKRKLCIYPPSRIFSSERTHAPFGLGQLRLSCDDFYDEFASDTFLSCIYLKHSLTAYIWLLSYCLFFFKKNAAETAQALVPKTATCCVTPAKRVIWMRSA